MSEKLDPTLEQRLILINQYKILEKLYPDEADSYARSREILENGYTIHFSDLVEGISPKMQEKEMEEVLDVLDMYSSLKYSISLCQDDAEFKGKTITFPGFDGNHEIEQLNYARFFIHRLERFDSIRKNDSYESYNSHYPTLGKYRQLLTLWKNLDDRFSINPIHLKQFVDLGVHLSNIGDVK